MKSRICLPTGLLFVSLVIAPQGWGADTARPNSSRPSASSAGRTGTAKGPLPDPALLDGSSQPAEKKSEYGMVGDFELPGDENVRDGKVGGPQNPNATAGGQSNNQALNMPQGGGGGAQAKPKDGAQGQQGGGAGGPENPNAAGKPIAGAGEQGAQPQGMQVAELGGGPSGQSEAKPDGAGGGKPQPMAIGDKAMRIEPGTPVPGVVGAQQQIANGHVQQHDKTGTGGKAPTGPQGPGRIEKGRVVPAGL
jgi:hypothetical protein